MNFFEFITSDAYTLRLKGLYTLLVNLGRVSMAELKIYTSEEETELFDMIDILVSECLIKETNGYYEKA